MTAQTSFALESHQNTAINDSYSPSKIIDAASSKVDDGDIQGAEMMYKEALLDWVDDAREGAGIRHMDEMKDAIAELWCGYANFYFKLKKYKSCLDAYENATQCPISGSCGKIWRSYAQYCRIRKKPRTAQKVYLRALAGDGPSDKGAVTNETERFKLWNDFLMLTRESTNNPTLTIDALMTAVREEHNNTKSETNTDTSNLNPVQNASTDEIKERPIKVQKTHHPDHASSALPNNINSSFALQSSNSALSSNYPQGTLLHQQPTLSNPAQSHFSMSEKIQTETKRLLAITQGSIPPELMAVWLATDGDTSPSRPEPPLFTASPPKLSDVSGKDILGSEMALKLLRVLCNTKEGNIILDVCKGCWIMTALKEQEVVGAIKTFEEKMNADLEALETNLAARLSVAGPALQMTVQQTNDCERNETIEKWNQKRQQLLDSIAWEFRKLLAIQQSILTSANLPGFQGTTVNASTITLQSKICSVMHSAFFLRNRIDEKTHLAMLTKLEEKLSKETVTPPPLPPMAANPISFPPPPLQQPQQHQQIPNLPPPPFPQHGPLPSHGQTYPIYSGLPQPMYPPPIPPPMGMPHAGLHPVQSAIPTTQQQRLNQLSQPSQFVIPNHQTRYL